MNIITYSLTYSDKTCFTLPLSSEKTLLQLSSLTRLNDLTVNLGNTGMDKKESQSSNIYTYPINIDSTFIKDQGEYTLTTNIDKIQESKYYFSSPKSLVDNQEICYFMKIQNQLT